MAGSRAKQLKTLVNKSKKQLSEERIEELSKLFSVVDGAIVYELKEYLTMTDEELFMAIQDALDYDMQSAKHGGKNNDGYIEKYNKLVEKDERENFAIEELLRQKIKDLVLFAPPHMKEKLENCAVYVLNHEIWIAVNERVKLICFFTDEHELSEIHLFGYNPFGCREDMGFADTAMYVFTHREQIFNADGVPDALKVWRSAVMKINKELWEYKSVIVENLLFFRKYGATRRKFDKKNLHGDLHFSISFNLECPKVISETINGQHFRRHSPSHFKLKNTSISYIHRLAEYIINFRYKILPEELKDE